MSYKFYTLDNSFIKEYDFYPNNFHQFTGIVIHENIKEYIVDGKNHREDGPAVIWKDGTKFWCINDNNHRLDGPAIEWANGNKDWYIHGRKCTKEQHGLLINLMKLKGLLDGF